MINQNSFKGPMGISVVAIITISVFTFLLITNIATSIFYKSEEVNASQIDSLIAQHDELRAADIAKFNGRSPFFKPIPIPRRTPPPQIVEEEKPEVPAPIIPTGPPPPPANYMGPTLIAIIGDEAWFRGSGSGMDAVIRLKVGEEENGLKLIRTAEPSMATVEYRRGEYEIDLFTYEEPFFADEAPPMQEPDFLETIEETSN